MSIIIPCLVLPGFVMDTLLRSGVLIFLSWLPLSILLSNVLFSRNWSELEENITHFLMYNINRTTVLTYLFRIVTFSL